MFPGLLQVFIKTQTFQQTDLSRVAFEAELDHYGIFYEQHLLGYDTPESHYRYHEEIQEAVTKAPDVALKKQALPLAETGSDHYNHKEERKYYLRNTAQNTAVIIALIVASVTVLLVYMMIDQNKPEMGFATTVLLGL